MEEIESFVPYANLIESSDPKKAEEVLIKASLRGDGHASHNLAIDYLKKGEIEKGRVYLLIAIEQGDQDASDLLDEIW